MIKSIKTPIKIIHLDIIDYQEAWNYQEVLFQEIITNKSNTPNNKYHYLIFCQHPPTITIGKNGEAQNLLLTKTQLDKKNIAFYRTNRGGDITFHGPGQLVVYPLLDLDLLFTDIHKYLRYLEQVVIDVLANYNIKADRSLGQTGVWVDILGNPRKICAMGVRASRWVTMHGLALNVSTDLGYFDLIVPCGIKNKAVTSMEKELRIPIDIISLKTLFIEYFLKQFQLEAFS